MNKETNRTLLIETQYLPPIYSIARMIYHGKVLIEQHEHFIKSTYRNRCYIATPNGRQRMSLPLANGKGQRRVMEKVQIAYSEQWQKIHWDTICYAYRSSPYFEYYEDHFEPFYQQHYPNLIDFNTQLLALILQLIGAEIVLEKTSSFQKKYDDTDILDFRSVVHPKKEQEKQDSLFTPPVYHQVFEEKIGFLPHLSIIDLLFAEGPQTLGILKAAM